MGGASLRSREIRSTFSRKSVPSPISYDPDLLYAQQQSKYQVKGKLYLGKPPRYGCVSGVSIPYKLFDGFDIFRGKQLILRPPRLNFRRCSESLLQHFPYELCKTTLKYKGNQWSKLKSKRKLILSSDPHTPGVGHYDLLDRKPKSFEVYLDKLRVYNAAMGKSLRSTDQFLQAQHNQDYPAPATYNINFKPVYDKEFFGEFGTFLMAERFPTEYIRKKKFRYVYVPPMKISTQRCWPAFNSSSAARPPISETETILGPADFNIANGTIFDRLRKELEKERVVAAFNSSTERKYIYTGNENPGPGSYDLFDKPKRIIYGARNENNCIPAVVLTSLQDLKKREVAPCTYDISQATKSVYCKRDFHKGPIWKKEKEFYRTKWVIKKDSPDALYVYKDVCSRRIGQPIFNLRPKVKRFQMTPGPADYHIHPLYSEGCIKSLLTHNVTSDLASSVYKKPKSDL